VDLSSFARYQRESDDSYTDAPDCLNCAGFSFAIGSNLIVGYAAESWSEGDGLSPHTEPTAPEKTLAD
jgi:hypothetical protein